MQGMKVAFIVRFGPTLVKLRLQAEPSSLMSALANLEGSYLVVAAGQVQPRNVPTYLLKPVRMPGKFDAHFIGKPGEDE